MTIPDSILNQAELLVTQPGFDNEPLHQIGRSAYFVVSAPEHAEGFQKKGEITVASREYPIVFVPQTC